MAVKQQIPSSTNAPKTMQFAKLKGVDYSTSPFEVNPSRAVDMRNIINDDGINHKRPGWTENTEFLRKVSRFQFGDKLLNAFDLNNGNLMLAFPGQLVIVDSDFKEVKSFLVTPMNNKSKTRFVRIDNRKILIFYTIETGEENFIYFDTYLNEFSEYDYIPTTTISINPDSQKESSKASLEEPSLISNKRKNKILSGDKAPRITIEYAGENAGEYLNKVKLTGTSGNSLMGYFDASKAYKKITAVMLEDVYELDITLLLSTSSLIYIKKKVEKVDETTGITKEEVIEEVITSIDLTEDTTIYIKEA